VKHNEIILNSKIFLWIVRFLGFLKKWYFHFLRPPTQSFCVEPPGGVAESTGFRLEKFWILQLQASMPSVQNVEMKIFEKEFATSKSDALREN